MRALVPRARMSPVVFSGRRLMTNRLSSIHVERDVVVSVAPHL
jgi:hypothetical protein